MIEFEPFRVQHQPGRARAPVADVAANGGSKGCEVDPDLVLASRDGPRLDQQAIGPTLQYANARLGAETLVGDSD